MTTQEIKLKNFYEDKANWRPPSYSQVCKFMGWKSKRSAMVAIKKIYAKKETKEPKNTKSKLLESNKPICQTERRRLIQRNERMLYLPPNLSN